MSSWQHGRFRYPGSNPVIGNFYCRKDEKINIKETGNGKVRKYFCPENYLKEEKNQEYFISLIKSRIFCSWNIQIWKQFSNIFTRCIPFEDHFSSEGGAHFFFLNYFSWNFGHRWRRYIKVPPYRELEWNFSSLKAFSS